MKYINKKGVIDLDILNYIGLLGGLALFLYGMDLMSDALASVSGSKLKQILESLTSSNLKGILLGAGITAIIQSSSGTTVIVVGLVNSGIMTLTQAASVIMGANIGTTMTAWILSLASISSDNLLIELLKPTSFSPILALIGVILIMKKKSQKSEEIGKILMGFSILMFGMNSMSTSMSPLAESPKFTNAMMLFSNPILGVLAGAAITAIIQSSSASIGILQSLSSQGIVSFGSAIPIIMGQNIGTCATALISTVGASKPAKRAGIIHLLFNIIGTFLFLTLFYIINAIRPFSFMDSFITPVNIATVHTIMNILTTIVLFPFTNKFVEITKKLVPVKSDSKIVGAGEFSRLDTRLIETPGLALQEAFDISNKMFDLTIEAVEEAVDIVENFNEEKYYSVVRLEKAIDLYEDKLGSYVSFIAKNLVLKSDQALASVILQAIGEFERMSDHAKNIAQSAKEMDDKKLNFSDVARGELEVYKIALLKQ